MNTAASGDHLFLGDGYSTRSLTASEAPVVTALVAACERQDVGEVLIELDDIVGDWQRPSFDLADDSLGVFDEDQLVAYAEVYRARRAEVHVHPRWRGLGLGTALMRWTWDHVRRHGGSLVGQTVPASLTSAVDLFRANGYRPMWTSWVLELPEGAQIAPVELPDGFAIRSYEPDRDERAVFDLVETAFNEWPDRDPSSYEDWAAGVIHRPGFEPWQLLLVVRSSTAPDATGDVDDEIVGVCHTIIYGDTGWVNQIAVARAHRGHGLGRAVLLRAFAEARSRGATKAELNTDSRTGALGLYLHVGMRVKSTFEHWARRL